MLAEHRGCGEDELQDTQETHIHIHVWVICNKVIWDKGIIFFSPGLPPFWTQLSDVGKRRKKLLSLRRWRVSRFLYQFRKCNLLYKPTPNARGVPPWNWVFTAVPVQCVWSGWFSTQRLKVPFSDFRVLQFQPGDRNRVLKNIIFCFKVNRSWTISRLPGEERTKTQAVCHMRWIFSVIRLWCADLHSRASCRKGTLLTDGSWMNTANFETLLFLWVLLTHPFFPS